MKKFVLSAMATACLPLAAWAMIEPEISSSPQDEPAQYYYSDIARFENVLEMIADGQAPETAFESYLQEASPGLVGWTGRYQVSPERFALSFESNAPVYQALPLLEDRLRGREDQTSQALEALRNLAQSDEFFYVYYFVSSQHLYAGTPIFTPGGDGEIGIGVALGIDPDLPQPTSFEDVPIERTVDDLTYIAVHEASHILQLRAQTPENYLSIYEPGGGTMLSIAIREGCAEYLTYLASGWRFGDRHTYYSDHEERLWEEFKTIADEDAFSVPGWFSGRAEHDPERPFQIGYTMGFEVCKAYHLDSDNPDERVAEIFGMYDEDHIAQMADAYDRYLSRRS